MFSISKMRKYKRQVKLIAEYASIIAEWTGLNKESDEVQNAAIAIYIKEYGNLVRMGP